jgi:hypothetical protein
MFTNISVPVRKNTVATAGYKEGGVREREISHITHTHFLNINFTTLSCYDGVSTVNLTSVNLLGHKTHQNNI